MPSTLIRALSLKPEKQRNLLETVARDRTKCLHETVLACASVPFREECVTVGGTYSDMWQRPRPPTAVCSGEQTPGSRPRHNAFKTMT